MSECNGVSRNMRPLEEMQCGGVPEKALDDHEDSRALHKGKLGKGQSMLRELQQEHEGRKNQRHGL